jgi:hypothetical protein
MPRAHTPPSCPCTSALCLTALVGFSIKKDSAARLLQHGAAHCRQCTRPPWPSPARRRRTHAPSRAAPLHHTAPPIHLARHGRRGPHLRLGRPAPPSTSPIGRKGWPAPAPAPAPGCTLGVDVSLTSACRMLQVFHMDVARSRCYICCNDYTHMLQASVPNVLSVFLDVCCK